MAVNIHPTALVSPGAELGDNVCIGPCACIDDNVIIGEGTRVDGFATIRPYTRLGKGNHIFSYAMVGEVPQDLKFDGEVTWLEIGDHNRIREFSTLHRGTGGGGGLTRIGNHCLLMAYTHVAHDCKLGSGVIMSNGATLAGHVEVQDNAIIGGLSAIHQFVRVGRNAFVGGMTGIAMDLPPYMLAAGVRSGIQGLNAVGLRRLNLPKENLAALRAAFKLIWLSGIPRKEALDKTAEEFAAVPQVMEILDFIRSSERGVLAADRNLREQ